MKVATKPKGRPPVDTPRMSTIAAAVTFRERHKVRTEANEAGLSVSAYVRRKLGLDGEKGNGESV